MRRRTDRGTAAVELAVVAPVFLALLMVVIFAGRISQAGSEVQSAAAAAARAASQTSDWESAENRAETVGLDNLDAGEVTCSDADVDLTSEPADFHPGGVVQVTVTCTTPLEDLMFLAFPSERSLSATSTEVIDTYRGGGP